jgi:hypothetical protein
MHPHNIDMYLIQETWLEETDKHYRQIEIDGYSFSCMETRRQHAQEEKE